jgi:ESCRT-II complex subunit VPS22
MSKKKGVGLAAFDRRHLSTQQYADHGRIIHRQHIDELSTQLAIFQSLLAHFSTTHSAAIRSDPSFRATFARMCNAIGVDPLASSSNRKGNFWAEMLGGSVNDFYFGLAVRVVEVCRATRAENGGLISVREVRERVEKGAGGLGGEVSEYVIAIFLYLVLFNAWIWIRSLTLYTCSDDILRAVKSLKPLGSGFAMVTIGKTQMIRSVPKELNTDQSTVLETIQILGYVTVSMLQVNLGWERARSQTVIDDLLADSLVWVDMQAEETEYWSPTFIHDGGG